MKQKAVRGLARMSNGAGPFRGDVTIEGLVGEAEMLVGLATEKDGEHHGRCVVALVHQERNFVWGTGNPVSCETVARMLEAMGIVRQEQLLGMGFVETPWMKVLPDIGKKRRRAA